MGGRVCVGWIRGWGPRPPSFSLEVLAGTLGSTQTKGQGNSLGVRPLTEAAVPCSPCVQLVPAASPLSGLLRTDPGLTGERNPKAQLSTYCVLGPGPGLWDAAVDKPLSALLSLEAPSTRQPPGLTPSQQVMLHWG